jgi:hypothetical protein
VIDNFFLTFFFCFGFSDFASVKIGAEGYRGGSWPDLDMLPLGWLTDPGVIWKNIKYDLLPLFIFNSYQHSVIIQEKKNLTLDIL